MMKKAIATDKAPAAIGPYSQAIEVGNLIFTSGVIPVVPETGEIPQGAQAHEPTVLLFRDHNHQITRKD